MSLDEIKSRWQAATPGPWKAKIGSYSVEGIDYTGGSIPGVCEEFHDGDGYHAALTECDAEFIAHAPEDVRRLLNAVEAVLERHRPFEWSFGQGPVQSCEECADRGMSQKDAEYPCPTVKAITTALEVKP